MDGKKLYVGVLWFIFVVWFLAPVGFSAVLGVMGNQCDLWLGDNYHEYYAQWYVKNVRWLRDYIQNYCFGEREWFWRLPQPQV